MNNIPDFILWFNQKYPKLKVTKQNDILNLPIKYLRYYYCENE